MKRLSCDSRRPVKKKKVVRRTTCNPILGRDSILSLFCCSKKNTSSTWLPFSLQERFSEKTFSKTNEMTMMMIWFETRFLADIHATTLQQTCLSRLPFFESINVLLLLFAFESLRVKKCDSQDDQEERILSFCLPDPHRSRREHDKNKKSSKGRRGWIQNQWRGETFLL